MRSNFNSLYRLGLDEGSLHQRSSFVITSYKLMQHEAETTPVLAPGAQWGWCLGFGVKTVLAMYTLELELAD